MGDTRDRYLQVQHLYLPVALAVFAIVAGVVLYAVVRYRRRGDDHAASQKSESRAEYAYAAVLVAIAALLTGWTFRAEDREDRLAAAPGLRVRVVASQWKWRFDYLGRGFSVVGTERRVPTLVVPVGAPVRFAMTSPDVIHAFWVPARRFKRDAFPGSTTRFDLLWTKPGFDRGGRCAEFCGIGHDSMLFNVRALPREEFERWAAAR